MVLVQGGIDGGAHVDSGDGLDRAVLMWFAFPGSSKIIGGLISPGTTLDLRDRLGRPAFVWAAILGQASTVD